MSLVNLAHVCSHLQNASKARLGLTSVPYTSLHATLAAHLLRAGFISAVTIGGAEPPPGPSPLLSHTAADSVSSGLAGLTSAAPDDAGVITPANRASRRVWLALKYWDSQPVISRMSMVSRPTRRIWCGVEDLARLARGQRAGYVQGLRQVGEVMFVSTDRGMMDVRECVERGVGGQLLVRIY